jgi:hypothetical protein
MQIGRIRVAGRGNGNAAGSHWGEVEASESSKLKHSCSEIHELYMFDDDDDDDDDDDVDR